MGILDDTARTLAIVAGWRSTHGLTAHQAEVLIHVHQAGAITAAEACRVIGITTASMTRIVAHLEQGGWVLRVRDDADARRLILQPTKQLALAVHELELAMLAGTAGESVDRAGGRDAV